MIDAYIGLGSNLGDRVANVAAALRAIAGLPATEIAAVSHAYETEPWGVQAQDAFVDAVARIRTELYADQLLDLLQDIEQSLGRVRTVRFGPRVIDLDVLLYGDEEWDSERLTIPHPRMAEREFVIRPLLEIAPDVRWPNGDYVTDEEARLGKVIADLGPVPGFERLTPCAEGEERRDCPVDPNEEWVPVGPPRRENDLGVSQTDFSLLFYETLLKEAGIPCEFYPHRPGEWHEPWPYAVMGRPVRLMVPKSRAEQATRLIAEADRAR